MPWSIVHYQEDLLTALEIGRSDEFADTCYRGFIVEPGRLGNEEFAASIGNKATVCHSFPTRIGFDLWTASLGEPLAGNGGFHREVNLVLENNPSLLLREELLQFFLNSPRFGSSSRSFEGNACGRILENPS